MRDLANERALIETKRSNEIMHIQEPFDVKPQTPELKEYWKRVNDLTPPSKPDLSQYTVQDTKAILWEIIKNRIPNFEATDLKVSFIKSFIQWVYKDPECKYSLNKGFLLVGNPGSGKTQLMQAFSEWTTFIEKRPFKMCYTKEVADEVVKQKDLKAIDKFKYGSFCYDEIGHEIGLTKLWGNAVNLFGDLFEFRSRYPNLISHGTSNRTMNRDEDTNLYSIYGERVYSRFHQMFNIVSYNGKDYRIENY